MLTLTYGALFSLLLAAFALGLLFPLLLVLFAVFKAKVR